MSYVKKKDFLKTLRLINLVPRAFPYVVGAVEKSHGNEVDEL